MAQAKEAQKEKSMRKAILLVALAATLSGCTPAIILMTPSVPAVFKAPVKAEPKLSAREQ